MDQRPGFKAYYLDASSSSIPSDWSEPHESMDEHHKFSVNLKKNKKKRGKNQKYKCDRNRDIAPQSQCSLL